MDFGVLGDLNWIAVIIAGLAYYALGAVWYAQAVFGRAWQQSMGWEPAADYRPAPTTYVVPLVTCLVSAIAVGMLAEGTATDTFAEGIVLGLVVGIGIAATGLFVTGFFDPLKPKPMTTTTINGATRWSVSSSPPSSSASGPSRGNRLTPRSALPTWPG